MSRAGRGWGGGGDERRGKWGKGGEERGSESHSVSCCPLSTAGPVIIFPGDNRNRVNAGEDVTLICDTRGSNPDVTNITISSGGVDLKSTNSSQMLGYTVVNASLNDNATNYTCTAFNSLGENPKTFSLVVQGVCVYVCVCVCVSLAMKLCHMLSLSLPSARPDMVDNSTVVSTLLSLLVTNLTWSPPLENNSPITSYTVTTCNPNTNCLVEQPSAPYLILYVLPEESCTVTITATNGVGTSDPSETVVIYGAMNGVCVCVRACVCDRN